MKLKSLGELERIVSKLKHSGKRVVLANGCFDLIHVGHVRYLDAAKKLGDCLIVGVNSDRSARKLKGKGRPLVKAKERVEIVSGFGCVDYCFIFDEPTLDACIRRLKPDIHAKGTDYTKDNVPERSTVSEVGGRVKIVGDRKSHATRDMVRVILGKFSRDK